MNCFAIIIYLHEGSPKIHVKIDHLELLDGRLSDIPLHEHAQDTESLALNGRYPFSPPHSSRTNVMALESAADSA